MRRPYSKIARTHQSIFKSIASSLFEQSIETNWVFPVWKSTSHFLSQSTLSHRSGSKSEINSSCCHKLEAHSHLAQRIVSSAQMTFLLTTSSGGLLLHQDKRGVKNTTLRNINKILLQRLPNQNHCNPRKFAVLKKTKSCQKALNILSATP